MRLIDLDQIEYFTLVDKLGVPRYKVEIGEDIGIEEVQAIPIEYIEAFKKEVRDVTNGEAVIDWLLENWEKENGTV